MNITINTGCQRNDLVCKDVCVYVRLSKNNLVCKDVWEEFCGHFELQLSRRTGG